MPCCDRNGMFRRIRCGFVELCGTEQILNDCFGTEIDENIWFLSVWSHQGRPYCEQSILVSGVGRHLLCLHQRSLLKVKVWKHPNIELSFFKCFYINFFYIKCHEIHMLLWLLSMICLNLIAKCVEFGGGGVVGRGLFSFWAFLKGKGGVIINTNNGDKIDGLVC